MHDLPFELLERALTLVELGQPPLPEARIDIEAGQQRRDFCLGIARRRPRGRASRPAGRPASPAPRTPAGDAKAEVPPLLPGLNVDSSFWKGRLAELNQGESSFEQLEWKIVHAVMDAARRYVKSVVMPAVTGAERR